MTLKYQPIPPLAVIALLCALALLNASLTFRTSGPRQASSGLRPVIELAVFVLGLALASRRFGAPRAGFSHGWQHLAAAGDRPLRDVTAPAVYDGRSIYIGTFATWAPSPHVGGEGSPGCGAISPRPADLAPRARFLVGSVASRRDESSRNADLAATATALTLLFVGHVTMGPTVPPSHAVTEATCAIRSHSPGSRYVIPPPRRLQRIWGYACADVFLCRRMYASVSKTIPLRSPCAEPSSALVAISRRPAACRLAL